MHILGWVTVIQDAVGSKRGKYTRGNATRLALEKLPDFGPSFKTGDFPSEENHVLLYFPGFPDTKIRDFPSVLQKTRGKFRRKISCFKRWTKIGELFYR